MCLDSFFPFFCCSRHRFCCVCTWVLPTKTLADLFSCMPVVCFIKTVINLTLQSVTSSLHSCWAGWAAGTSTASQEHKCHHIAFKGPTINKLNWPLVVWWIKYALFFPLSVSKNTNMRKTIMRMSLCSLSILFKGQSLLLLTLVFFSWFCVHDFTLLSV